MFLLAQVPPIKEAIGGIQTTVNFPTAEVSETTGLPVVPWPGLDGQIQQTPPVVPEPAPYTAAFTTNWLSAAGDAHPVADIISLIVLGRAGRALRIYGRSLNQLKWAILTIASILGLAYLLNWELPTLGLAFAATGALFPFFAAFIGWLGVALTGSDTSSNALFANCRRSRAADRDQPVLTVGANSSGGVLGKMISRRTSPSARAPRACRARRATCCAWSSSGRSG